MRKELAFALVAAAGAFAIDASAAAVDADDAGPNGYGGRHGKHTKGHKKASTTYVTEDYCPSSAPPETIITVMEGVTVTYCPACMGTTYMPGVGYTTEYVTHYKSLCPTGLVEQTYTVTESCSEPTPTWEPGRHHIPQGFTVTTKSCGVCGPETTSVTITEPCGCEAHEGTPGPPPMHPMPTPPPMQSGGSPPSGGMPPAGKPPGGRMGGNGAPPAPECSGEPECGGTWSTNSTPMPAPPAGATPAKSASMPPYPTTSMSMTQYRSGPSGSAAVPPMSPNTPLPQSPPVGVGAASTSVAMLSSVLLGGFIALLAITL